MFGFNIAKEAEKGFTRWAMRRVCKFLLKKKLGKYILGEIDLNQLDVQLSDGTIQLSDLALNVDYLNQKLGTRAALIIQEGSIGSLIVTMPWKSGGCQVELEELELVIAPRGRNLPPDKSDTGVSDLHDNSCARQDFGKMETDGNNSVALSSVDVLEGVKTIAKMVKWLLSSFHVKIRKLIVALDPNFGGEHNKSICRTLVLRIAETECGTHISEEFTPINDSREDNFLGLSRLTNFLRFEGAVLEFLHMDNVDIEGQCPSNKSTTSSGFSSVCCQSNAMTPIITSKNGGISGNLNLCIPWKNGSLDIRKVDAHAYIDPMELRFQPSTIACFIYLWDVFKDSKLTSDDDMLSEGTESVYDDAVSKCSSSTLGSSKFTADPVAENNCSVVGQGSYNEDVFKRGALLSDSHLISDWAGSQNDSIADPDFGASMYQFFECFDELRSSRSALGNSKMWNWTCSVFSAITAASNLASGSMHSPLVDPEQQHVETNFMLTISQVSLVLSFFDKDHVHYCGTMDNRPKAGSDERYLGAQLNGLCLVTQVCPAEMNFDIKVEHVELDDYFIPQDEIICSNKLHGHCDSVKCHVEAIQKIKDGVEDALIPYHYQASFSMATRDGYDSSARQSMGSQSTWSNNCQMTDRDDFVKNNLLKTSGIFHCRVSINTRDSGNIFAGPISFTLKLPPLTIWVNFSLVDLISDLLKRIGSIKNASACEDQINKSSSASQGSERKDTGSCGLSGSTNESVKGNIFLSDTRVILCFPYCNGGDSASYSLFNQFIALDFSFAPMLLDTKIDAFEPFSATSSRKRFLLSSSRSLHVIMGSLNAYFITSHTQDVNGSEFCCMLKPKYIAKEIMSIADGTSGSSVISMFWQESALTGPWIVNKAKLLATDGTLRNSDKFMGKDCEFACVITVKDAEDSDIHTKQEIISSSGFFLHVKFLPVMINLEKAVYDSLLSLLHQLGGCLSSMTSDSVCCNESVSQGAILAECDSVEVSVTLAVEKTVKGSVHKDLSGSWNRLRFTIQNFALLSVSDIGGVRDASFLWMAHREGNLLGSVSGVPSEELLLISCSNSCLGRGDGEGSNVLSPMFPGSDIIHLGHPEDLHSYTSVGMRCVTIVTRDGHLNWWDQVHAFFSFPCEIEPTGDKSLPRERCGSSFILNLADFALSYEPFSGDSVGHKCSSSEPFSDSIGADTDQSCFACLLAVSSLRLSNTDVPTHSVGEYKITVQELGLLLCPASGSMNVFGQYGADHLRMVGYRKIAHVPHIEAILKTFRDQFPAWEVECSNSHIALNTCHDTAAGLIRLCDQLQQLFAPDVEDTVVHLQTRWYNIKRANEDIENRNSDVDASSSAPKPQNSETNSTSCLGNLMDEICLDAFQLDDNADEHGGYRNEHLHRSFDGYHVQSSSPIAQYEKVPAHSSFTRSLPVLGLENNGISFLYEKTPQFIEEYFLSDLQPPSGSSLKGEPSKGDFECKTDVLDCKKNRGWYGDASLKILDNHILDADEQNNLLHPEHCEASTSYANNDSDRELKGRVLFKNMKVLWRMYGGSDWKSCQKTAKLSAVSSGRDATVCLEISLSGLKIQYDISPDGVVPISRLSLTIQDISLNDCSRDAPWKLVLGYYHSKNHPRKSSSQALKLDLECVRPDPSTPLEEYRLRLALLPMRLQLHQSQLDFLINFFGGERSCVESPKDNMHDKWELGKEPLRAQGIIEEALLPFFQQFDIWPFLIRVDYSPRHVDLAALRSGKYVELINLVPWKGVELQLKHVHAVGVYGWNSVCETMIGEWLEDISQNQVHKLLKGLPPIRSLVAVGSSAAKLVTIPVKSYRKDQRLLKGMQRGTISFLRSISLEAIGLGVHLAAEAHEILLQAEYILMSIPPSVAWLPERRGHTDVTSNQPKDALQGVKLAYESMNEGLNKSASALVRTPLKKYQRGGGVGSALASVIKATPVAAIAPASAAARAMHCALLGVRNSLDPERKKESLDKYLGPTQHRKFT